MTMERELSKRRLEKTVFPVFVVIQELYPLQTWELAPGKDILQFQRMAV